MTVPPHLGSSYAVDLFLIPQPEECVAKGMPSQDISLIHTSSFIRQLPGRGPSKVDFRIFCPLTVDGLQLFR
jgi:hypothetical protein